MKIRCGPRPLRPAKAWLLPGDDPARWLDELSSWQAPLEAVRLLPVPRSPRDRRPLGLLATGKVPARVSPGCVPFGTRAGRLFLPVEAWLEPEVSDEELESLLSGEVTYVWHPACGRAAFGPDEVLTAADLLSAPPPARGRWDLAQAGVTLAPRLTAIAPDAEPTAEEAIDAGREDIGEDSDSLAELPPSPTEPQRGALGAARRGATAALAGLAGMISRLARQASSGIGAGWGERLGQWAEKQRARLSEALQAARFKELERLLHLLQTDPDRGLRFAPSLSEDDARRGNAAPSGHLRERDVDFSLRRLGGGGPVDGWQVPNDYHYQLTVHYRQLANREMHLGRYRRAAYIFAELLGDFDAAASALAAGRHWREAAVLYRQRLNRPLHAARCLEQGGLWSEAIELYVELQQHEKAGDLFRQLQQHEAAHSQYRLAVERHRGHDDSLEAARLLDEKLDSPDEAVNELLSGWPDSRQAALCLRRALQLQGRIGRHEATSRLIAGWRQASLTPPQQKALVDILADVGVKYPDQAVQHQAADCTRALVSRQFPGASITSRRQMLAAVSKLVPHDRLLRRDCQRLLSSPPDQDRPAAPVRKRLRRVRRIRLVEGDVQWKAAAACGVAIFAAGVKGSELLLARCSWKGAEPGPRKWRLDQLQNPILLVCDPGYEDFLLLHAVGCPPLDMQEFSAPDIFHQRTQAGGLRAVSPRTLAAARRRGLTWLLETRSRRITLRCVARDGGMLSTEMVQSTAGHEHLLGSAGAVPLCAGSKAIYLGLGHQLHVLTHQGGESDSVLFSQPIRSLSASSRAPRCVAAAHARGGTLIWEEGLNRSFFGERLQDPVVGFSRGGLLIAASQDCCQVYSAEDELQLRLEAEMSGSTPIAVLASPNADLFGVATERGEIEVYELP